MGRYLLFLLLAVLPAPAQAQQIITLRKLWTAPEVEVIFNGYHIYMRIKDIDKALSFLPESVHELYGATCGLDPNRATITEIEPGTQMQYRDHLQPLMQKEVGCYLLMSGHVYIKNRRHRHLKTIEAHIGPERDFSGIRKVPVTIYDPKNGNMIFQGEMNSSLYHKDLGLD